MIKLGFCSIEFSNELLWLLKISPFVYFVLATLVLCGCGDDNDSNVISYDFDVSSSSEITESSESQSSSSSLKKTSSFWGLYDDFPLSLKPYIVWRCLLNNQGVGL